MSEKSRIEDGALVVELAGRAYDAAASPSTWLRFLEHLCDTLGLQTANLVMSLSDARGDHVALPFTWQADAASLADYANYFGQIDPHRLAAIERPRGEVRSHPELVPDGDFVKSEYYNDFYARIGLRHGATMILHNSGGHSSALSCHRSPDQGPLDRVHLDFLRRLAPHLIRARSLTAQLGIVESQQRIIAEVLDRLPVGIVFVDRARHVVLMNSRAERILLEQDGLDVRRGHLVADMPKQAAALDAIVATACDPVAAFEPKRTLSMCVARPSGRRDLAVMAYPVTRESSMWSAEGAAAFLVLSDGEAELAGAARRMSELYGLTHREAELSSALAGGLSVSEWAEQRGVSVETVRWQLKQVFAKTCTTRQPELTRVVLLGPAVAR